MASSKFFAAKALLPSALRASAIMADGFECDLELLWWQKCRVAFKQMPAIEPKYHKKSELEQNMRLRRCFSMLLCPRQKRVPLRLSAALQMRPASVLGFCVRGSIKDFYHHSYIQKLFRTAYTQPDQATFT
jgi:hypothetical protein